MQRISGVLGILLATPAARADAPPPDPVVIELFGNDGSRCAGMLASLTVAPDNTGLTVTLGELAARAGVGASPSDFRKNCSLNVLVHAPPGFAYAIDSAQVRGFASLAAGATAVERAHHFSAGQVPTDPIMHRFSGPSLGDWQIEDIVDPANIIFSPCQGLRNVNFNLEVRVNLGTSDPTTTTSSFAVRAASLHLIWRRCGS